ncbi:mitochondrial carrier [Gloeophyllum trabeum ATCC 11539]|uniref:Mitochondrial carrier n=1 Tax=Gloeophyllum trabeum (strain ATCC 11539 / FP-39264 / Madison 617) TaxID=670483 RepID=S7RIQ7_GLOTA|nr:mitochondrial carrier [Gloeophyllum trabeum ATCC 11539]EPQ54225.1 mitochondrial carrier [Gloeophyllum trabeum ATCC 11539]
MASRTVTSTPEEKLVVLESSTSASSQGGSQYGLKFAAAAVSNMAASAVSNPVDVIKVRQQLKTATPGIRGNAFWTVGYQMARTEGVLSLGSGMTASMMREVVYSGLRLGTYEYFKDSLYTAAGGSLPKEGLTLKVLAATIAATIGSFVANPADLAKVRMQAYYPNGSPYRNVFNCYAAVWREGATKEASSPFWGGLRSLYRGVDATTVRGIILSTSQICSYDQVKQSLKKRGIMEEGIGLHLTASLFAGLFCSITSNPVDVVKVRVMNDKERRYKGVVDCVRSIMVNEGPLAFFKGFGMCWARLGVHTIVSFIAFERIRGLLGISPM